MLLFRLIRWPNLLIIGLTQYCVACFLTRGSFWNMMQNTQLAVICLGTILIAGAGYIVNDYLDIKIDEINKPNKVLIGNVISRKWAILLHILMTVGAIAMVFLISKTIALIELITALLLVKYSSTYKRKLLIGNILISLFCGLVIFVVWIFDKTLSPVHVAAYGIFAFLTTLSREIIKDIEDIKGDRMLKCLTLPIVVGIKKTKNTLFIISSFLVTASTVYFYELFKSGRIEENVKPWFAVYVLFTLIGPFFYMLFKLNEATKTEDFSYISKINKLIMLTGILTLVFFKL